MFVFEEDIKAMEGFIQKEIDLSKTHGCIILGFFPYHCKSIRGNVRIPRTFFKEFEHILKKNKIYDNKYVVVCKDTENFATEDFAINFKDSYVVIGRWDEIEDY